MGCNVLYGLGSIQFWASNLLEKAKIQNSVQLPKKSITTWTFFFEMTTWTLLGSCPKQAQKISFGAWAFLGYFLFCDELNHHKGFAMSPPSHHHISRLYFFVTFFCPTWHFA